MFNIKYDKKCLSKFDIHSFDYFIERLKEKIIPSIDDKKEKLLEDKESLELMKQCWYEAYDIGFSYGYDEGHESCYDE